jgi:acyl carrier protein
MPDVLTEPELTELLKELADELLDIDLSDAGPSSRLDSLGMDSLDRLELITSVEDRLSIRIPDDRVSGLVTVGDLVQCLLDLQNQAMGAATDSSDSRSRL